MKNFISGLYHFIIDIIMWLPCHPLRRLAYRLLIKRFDASSAIYRNVDLRSPYRIVVGAHTNINKRCILDGRGGIIGNNVTLLSRQTSGLSSMITIVLLIIQFAKKSLLRIMYAQPQELLFSRGVTQVVELQWHQVPLLRKMFPIMPLLQVRLHELLATQQILTSNSLTWIQ